MASLVVLAAGLGTRFGGLKQLAEVGPNGEAIFDLLLRRAAAAGFDRAIVVVRDDIRSTVDAHLTAVGRPMPAELVVQPERRGTADAVLVARHSLDRTFAVVNADDLYPDAAFAMLAEHLGASNEHALVAFRVDRTLVNDQPVKRAAIEIDRDGLLVSITEQTVAAPTAGHDWVSMNMWGFQLSALDFMTEALRRQREGEVLLPDVVARMLDRGEVVRVLRCDESCIGITYAEDVEAVRRALS